MLVASRTIGRQSSLISILVSALRRIAAHHEGREEAGCTEARIEGAPDRSRGVRKEASVRYERVCEETLKKAGVTV